ncbi:MAG: hypothetical protein HGA37_11800 [Lentimicrobium sp.]|nr:hypothetical protein [Lentimicrobium sp.]
MKKVFCFLLVILTLQLSLDETLSHFDLSGSVDLRGNSTYATVTHHLQQFHDHLWIVTSFSKLNISIESEICSCSISSCSAFSEYTFSIWQPPKFLYTLV